MIDLSAIRGRFTALSPRLDERGRRSFAAAEAQSAGYGGIAAVSRATGIAASTIGRGLDELADLDALAANRVRRPGGGRKKLSSMNATLLDDLLAGCGNLSGSCLAGRFLRLKRMWMAAWANFARAGG